MMKMEAVLDREASVPRIGSANPGLTAPGLSLPATSELAEALRESAAAQDRLAAVFETAILAMGRMLAIQEDIAREKASMGREMKAGFREVADVLWDSKEEVVDIMKWSTKVLAPESMREEWEEKWARYKRKSMGVDTRELESMAREKEWREEKKRMGWSDEEIEQGEENARNARDAQDAPMD